MLCYQYSNKDNDTACGRGERGLGWAAVVAPNAVTCPECVLIINERWSPYPIGNGR